ncbi:MAG TPA: ABC transporter ATP-binding protein [Candidatus Angelobacter sp.]|nr:ABC transporter ATP-binding protein [Candidatus Angelobacter sp.]
MATPAHTSNPLMSEAESAPHGRRKFATAIGLLDNRQRASLIVLTLERIAVGCCDLLMAAAMYLLFMLLQGRSTAHTLPWLPHTTLSAALLTAALVALRALTDLLSARSLFRHIQELSTSFLLRLTQGYNQLQWARFVERNRGELLSRSLYTAREAADFYQSCIEIAAAVAIVAIMAAALIYQSVFAACLLGGALALFYSVHRLLIRSHLQRAASNREQSLRALQRNLADMFSSGKEIRAYGSQSFFHGRLSLHAKRLAASSWRLLLLPQAGRIIADQGAVLLFLFILIVVELRQGDASRLLSLLVFYFVISRRLLPLISQISFNSGQMESSFENVRILDFELKECARWRVSTPPAQPPEPGLALKLNSVSFSFPEGGLLLENVNFSLREGEIAVLHGASGIGKSSLLNLIAGILQPSSGVVCIDRAAIAYVPQEVPLLDDSIRNNLLFGLHGKNDSELMASLAAAMLDDFVTALPLGLDARVGDNGAAVSGGQRQRLGLARAGLRGGKLLLLDEATSALDEDNERKVLENLSASGVAILLATHRPNAQAFADRVIRLQAASLVEEQPRPSLTDSPGTSSVAPSATR